MPPRLLRALREPLLQFVALGGVLFAIHGWLNRANEVDGPPVVRLTASEMGWLVDTWSRRWQRAPSEHELRNLVADYLKEQLLAREARELELDENDAVITSRLAQKMEFLIEDTVDLGEPGEQELRRLYEANGADYRTPARASFTQIFFRTAAAAERGLREIEAQDPAVLGEPSLLERAYTSEDLGAVARIFGAEFADGLATVTPGRWQGPIASAYGFHLVNLTEWQEPQSLAFEDVRPRVLEDWRRGEQERVNTLLFTELLAKYDVVVDDSVKPLLDSTLYEAAAVRVE